MHDSNKRVIHRLKISLGHLQKTVRMVQEDTYCIDVIHQLQAVQRALKETGIVLMENHMKTCVASAIKRGNDSKVIQEIMLILKKS